MWSTRIPCLSSTRDRLSTQCRCRNWYRCLSRGGAPSSRGCRKGLCHSTPSTFVITVTITFGTNKWSTRIPCPSSTHGRLSTQCRCRNRYRCLSPGGAPSSRVCRKGLCHSTQSTFTITITIIIRTSMWSTHIPCPSSTHDRLSTQCRCRNRYRCLGRGGAPNSRGCRKGLCRSTLSTFTITITITVRTSRFGYPHPLPQQHSRPPQHTMPVPVPVPAPEPGRGAQQQGVSQGEARGVSPGEARRMGAPAAAPPLVVPEPGFLAAGSPQQTVRMPDPAVPRESPPVVPADPEPVVPGGGPPPTRGMQGAAPMGRPMAGERAGDAAQEAAVAGPRDISELLAQALEAYRRTAAGSGGAAPEGADSGELIAQALAAVAPRTEGAKETPTEAVSSGGQDAGRGVPKAQTPAEGGGVEEPSGGRAKGEGVDDWMWEWREWRQVAPGEPCLAGLAYSMDLHAGTSWARLPANLRVRLVAAEAARGGGADELPLAPFPPRPDTPPADDAAGEGAEGEQEAEGEGDEEAYGPGESALALMFEDDAGPHFYAGMDEDPANEPLRPMPTAVPPPPLRSSERRHCRYHAAEGAHRHRLMGTGQREAGMLASALEHYELQRPGQVAREMALAAASTDNSQVRCVQLGDAAGLGHHPGDVRAAEPQEGLPLSVLDEAGLEDVRRDEDLYVALWRGGADAWRREQAVRPHTPQALGSHALLVAVHREVAEVVFDADRLLLTGDGAVLVPTSSSYRIESRGGDLKLLVVVGTCLDESAAPQGSEHAIPVGADEEAGHGGDEVG